MITINNLDIQMDVEGEGEGDEAAFSRMFEKHITRWSRLEAEQKARQRLTDSERSVGDRPIREND